NTCRLHGWFDLTAYEAQFLPACERLPRQSFLRSVQVYLHLRDGVRYCKSLFLQGFCLETLCSQSPPVLRSLSQCSVPHTCLPELECIRRYCSLQLAGPEEPLVQLRGEDLLRNRCYARLLNCIL